jgi:hypothetical protein
MVAFGRALSEALRRVLKVCRWCFHGDLRPGSSHDLAAEVTVSTCCASMWTSNNARRPRRCSDRPWQLIAPTRSRSAQTTRRRAPSGTETSQNRAAIPAVPISAPTRIPTLNTGGPPRARAATPNTSGCTFSSTASPSSPAQSPTCSGQGRSVRSARPRGSRRPRRHRRAAQGPRRGPSSNEDGVRIRATAEHPASVCGSPTGEGPYGIGIACRRLPSRAVRRSVLRVFRLRLPPLPLRGLHGVAVPDTRY